MDIKITIEFNGKVHTTVNQQLEDKTFEEICKICAERKADITDLLINDITEMTAAKAEEVVMGWDM